jgi:hypothetical protein
MLSKAGRLSCMRQGIMPFEKVPCRIAPQEFKKITGLKKFTTNGQTWDSSLD